MNGIFSTDKEKSLFREEVLEVSIHKECLKNYTTGICQFIYDLWSGRGDNILPENMR